MEYEQIKNLDVLRQIHIDHAKKESSVIVKTIRPFDLLLDDLDEISKEIIDHLETGDLEDQALNSELWHRLYNIQHRIDNFCGFTGESAEKLVLEVHKVIDPLCDLRPPKDLH